MMSNDFLALFDLICETFLWRNLVNKLSKIYIFKLRLLMLKCLDVAFNDETFFFNQALNIKFEYRFIGQHIGNRLSNITTYRYRPKFSYPCIASRDRSLPSSALNWLAIPAAVSNRFPIESLCIILSSRTFVFGG